MSIELRVDRGGLRRITPEAVIVVGYTGADTDAVQHHIDELAAEGVAPPPQVPMYWSMPPSSLTQSGVIDVPSRATSGEIELALVFDRGEVFVAAASDHTCRETEAIDIRLSKLVCPTPISVEATKWSNVADHWNDLMLTSLITQGGRQAVTYQSAEAGGNRHPMDLVEGIPWTAGVPSTFVTLCGTVPAIGGIRPADRFEGAIEDPHTGVRLDLVYAVQPVSSLDVGLTGSAS